MEMIAVVNGIWWFFANFGVPLFFGYRCAFSDSSIRKCPKKYDWFASINYLFVFDHVSTS